MLKRLFLIVLCVLGIDQAWDRFNRRAVLQPDGVLVASEPVQRAIARPASRPFGDFVLTPLADFHIEGRVLLTSRYRLDNEARLSPYDLGIGWKRMSDSAVLRGLELSQARRFLLWHWRDVPPIPPAEITRSAANIHLIPADAGVEARIAALRPGQLVSLQGQLVEALRSDGWHWRSSLTREDEGFGACELLYVEAVMPR